VCQLIHRPRAAVSFLAVIELAPGLWRWTADHPDWIPGAPTRSPDDWERSVGSVLFGAPQAMVFIDPLLPTDEDAFWAWADECVGGRPVSVLTTIRWHRRSADQVAARYGASRSRAKRNLPAWVHSIVLRGAGETMFWLPEPQALIPGDRILGVPGGGLRLCPESWLGRVRVDREGLRALLEPLLELPVQRVVVSHGEPVLKGAGEALRRCLA
jgi:hypothetical protein